MRWRVPYNPSLRSKFISIAAYTFGGLKKQKKGVGHV
jgi:hypothetical protein